MHQWNREGKKSPPPRNSLFNHHDLVGREKEVDCDEQEENEGVTQNHADDEGLEEVPQPYATEPHDQRFQEPTKQHAETVPVTEPRDGAARRITERVEWPPEKLPTHPRKEQRKQSTTEHVEIL